MKRSYTKQWVNILYGTQLHTLHRDLNLIPPHNPHIYTVRQLYNETDFILTKIEVLSMKQSMPSM